MESLDRPVATGMTSRKTPFRHVWAPSNVKSEVRRLRVFPVASALLALVALALVGCGAKEEPAPTADTGVSAAPAPEPTEPVASNEAPASEEGWSTSLDEGLAKAKAENKMVLVDFSADW